jgi:hypothetical protein
MSTFTQEPSRKNRLYKAYIAVSCSGPEAPRVKRGPVGTIRSRAAADLRYTTADVDWLYGHFRQLNIRFADDFCIGCEREADARKIMPGLSKRFARFGLTIHPEKTALIAFGKPDAHQALAKGNGTFELLGLTHDWAKSHRGY